MICKLGENTQERLQNNMQKGDRAERLVAEIKRQQREYRRRLLRLEPGTDEWKLMMVRIEGNEIIKRSILKIQI